MVIPNLFVQIYLKFNAYNQRPRPQELPPLLSVKGIDITMTAWIVNEKHCAKSIAIM